MAEFGRFSKVSFYHTYHNLIHYLYYTQFISKYVDKIKNVQIFISSLLLIYMRCRGSVESQMN